jgi:c-di-GMP-binding flagellar brake protein YcgR
MNAPVAPEKKNGSSNVLFRSRIEICRLLNVLAQDRCALSAEVMNHHPFSSHLLAVNSVTEHFVIAYSQHKTINSMVLSSPSVEFTANHKELNYTFAGMSPEETRFENQPAIQFVLPKTLLLHNRREHPRIPIPENMSLRCIADEAGYIPFESHITDISHDGLGCLVYDSDINLENGIVLKGCRIILPNGDAVIVDLELRYAVPISLPDGTKANRAGLQFIQAPNEIKKLINHFIQDLDKK